jgi:hypothetical protein
MKSAAFMLLFALGACGGRASVGAETLGDDGSATAGFDGLAPIDGPHESSDVEADNDASDNPHESSDVGTDALTVEGGTVPCDAGCSAQKTSAVCSASTVEWYCTGFDPRPFAACQAAPTNSIRWCCPPSVSPMCP